MSPDRLTTNDDGIGMIHSYENPIYLESITLEISESPKRVIVIEGSVATRVNRVIPSAQAYITYMMLLAAAAMMGYALYIQISFITSTRAYYAIYTLPLILVGTVLFMFALKVVATFIFTIILDPRKFMFQNTQFFSSTKVTWPATVNVPPVIVQIPVYNENFDTVIKPTIESVKKAGACYKGMTRIIIFDDGLEVIELEERQKRLDYYDAYRIEYIARPAEGRAGLFKKASNLNSGLALLVKENRIPDDAIILLLDADSRVPETCMNDVIVEFILDPELPYTQHYTEALWEQRRNYWEGFITFFTRKIYFLAMGIGTALGDTCPLMGHNAFIRWRCLKSVVFGGEDVKYWTEESVSEDYDLFLRFAIHGKFGRYVMYDCGGIKDRVRVGEGGGWQEGISLTFIDEVKNLKKFTFGACEICFYPIKLWLRKGIVNHLFLSFLGSAMIKWYHKVNVCVYMITYFAMASAFYFVIAEAIMSAFFPVLYGSMLVHSFDVMVTSIIVFGGVNLLGEIIIHLRIKGFSGCLRVIWDELKWLPFLALFFNSILFHLTEISVIYFWSLPLKGWGVTVKEVTRASIFTTIRVFWKEYIVMLLLLGGYLSAIFINDMKISWGVVGYCGSHILGPLVFNPYILSLPSAK